MKQVWLLWLIILLVILCAPSIMAQSCTTATCTAASCSQANVQAAWPTSGNTNATVTVNIPACSGGVGWTTQLNLSVPSAVTSLSVVGAGTAATGGGDQTVIIDNDATNQVLLGITLNSASGSVFRMSGVTFQGGSGGTKDGGMIAIGGPGTARLDHDHFNFQTYSSCPRSFMIEFGTQVYGVMDHSILDECQTSTVLFINGSSDAGNTTWTQATGFGTSNFFFLEDNIINGSATSSSVFESRAGDCWTAGRFVVRFNTLTMSAGPEEHATGHSGDDRGCRAEEVYGNLYQFGSGQPTNGVNYDMVDMGNGGALAWGNSAPGILKNVFLTDVTRKDNTTYAQSAPPAGWGYCGIAFNGTGSAWDQSAVTSLGYACLDQPGRGPGDLLSYNAAGPGNGSFPQKCNLTQNPGCNIFTGQWPRQPLEPMYFWNNNASPASGWGGAFFSDGSSGRLTSNVDYYSAASGVQTSPTSPFNGTLGTGWGTLANRPTTCTTGVGYFATDQGHWNASMSNPQGVQQSGASGLLYTCTATNTWTLYYTPYTYPHPLNTSSGTPTITLNDAVNAGNIITATNPAPRAGLNLGQASGAFPQFRNLLQFANPGFEPQLVQQIFQFATNPCTFCTSSEFQWNVSNSNFTNYDANQWVGATFTVIAGCYSTMTGCTGGGGTGDPAFNCTGTIASNTAATGGFGSQFTTSAPCPGTLGIPGQIIVLKTNSSMANVGPPSAVGWPQATETVTGTASITAENTDLCAGCGTQSVEFATPTGTASMALSNTAYTTLGVEKTITMNGAYTLKFWAKSKSGSLTALTATETARNGACANPSPCAYTPTLTTSWAQYSHTFALTETPSPSDPFSIGLSFAVSAGADVLFDNVEFDDPSTNPTAFADTFVATLKAWCQSTTNTTGPGCTLRYGPSPDSEVMSNWVKSVFLAQPSTEAANSNNIKFTQNTGYFTQKVRIFDFLQLCQQVGAIPVLIWPVTFTTADVANLVDYLEDNTGSTTYGAIRQAQGQTTAWVGQAGSPFPVIYLEYGNENWNGLFLGHALFSHANNPNNYYDYAARMGVLLAAARSRQVAQSYNQNVTKWSANGQTGSTTDFKYLTQYVCGNLTYSGGASACTQGGEDVIEYQQYYADSTIAQTSTTGCLTSGSTNATCPLWGPALTETWSDIFDPASTSGAAQSLTAVQGIANCGPAHTSTCQPATYERAIYPTGSGTFTQAVSDSFTQTAWHGVADANSYSLSDTAGLAYIDEYATESYALSQGGVNVHIYGAFLDNGGDSSVTNAALFGGNYTPRPQMSGAEVYNWCKIGQEVTTTGSSIPTYNLPSNTNSVHAISNVPNLTFHEYKSGSSRCLLVDNNDIFNSYPVMFAGTNVPTTATRFQYAPSSPTLTNEATNLNPTSTVAAAATNYPVLTTGVNVTGGFTSPPTSVTAFLWTTGAAANITADFGSRLGTQPTIPPVMLGTNISGLSGSTPLYYLLPPVGLTHARLFVSIAQECPTGIGSCNWGIANAQVALLAAQGITVTIVSYATPSNLGASACTPPSNNASYAAILNAYFTQNPYPNSVDSAELRNEPDTVSGPDWCPSPGTNLSTYESFIGAVGPAVASANPSILVGGPALAAPGANAATWIPGVIGAWPGIGFVSYHLYLDSTCTAWASCLAGMQSLTNGIGFYFATVSGLVTGAGSSAPVWVTEFNDGYAFSADCCRFDNQFSLMWNTLNAADYLNSINTYGATVLPGRLHYYTDESTGWFCLFGNLAGGTCADTPAPIAPYPQYYSYELLGLLGLPLGGHLATSISPASTVSGLSGAAWYTTQGDSILLINPTASALTSQTVALNNTGIVSAQAISYLLNSSNPTNTAGTVTLTSAGGTSYTTTVTIPAYSTLGIELTAGFTTISHGAKISSGAIIR